VATPQSSSVHQHGQSSQGQRNGSRSESSRNDSGEFRRERESRSERDGGRERDERRSGSRNSQHSADSRGSRDSRDSRESREYKGLLAGTEVESSDAAPRKERRAPRREKGDFQRKGDRNSEEPRGLLSYVGEDRTNGLTSFPEHVAPQHEVKLPAVDTLDEVSLGTDDAALADVWETFYVESVRAWLKEIIDTIGYDVKFELRIASKTLHIDFDKDFVQDTDLSRSLYASLSFVLLQFLKREHKRRFRGLRITLSHPGQDPFRFDSAS
jgi:hypothetical protein